MNALVPSELLEPDLGRAQALSDRQQRAPVAL